MDGVTEELDGVTEELNGVTEELDGVMEELNGTDGGREELYDTAGAIEELNDTPGAGNALVIRSNIERKSRRDSILTKMLNNMRDNERLDTFRNLPKK